MRVLVCGGRDYTDYEKVVSVLEKIDITLLIEGGALGADRQAAKYAIAYDIPFVTFSANWHKYGKAAGKLRNKDMLEQGKPDLVVAFPGGTGTAHMVRIAKDANVEVMEIK